MHWLKLDEAVLRIINRSNIDDYHYPVQYLFNDEKRINKAAKELEFNKPEFAYIEQYGPRVYMPGPLKIIYLLLQLKRKLFRKHKLLISLTCRMTKSSPANSQTTSKLSARQ